MFFTKVHVKLALLRGGCRIAVRGANPPSLSLSDVRTGGTVHAGMRGLHHGADMW